MLGWIVALALVSLTLAALCVWLWRQRSATAGQLEQLQADTIRQLQLLSARNQALGEALVRAEAALVSAERRARTAEIARTVEATPDDQVARDLAAALAARRTGVGAVVGDRPAGSAGGTDLAGRAAGAAGAVPPAGALPAGADRGGAAAGLSPGGRPGGAARGADPQ